MLIEVNIPHKPYNVRVGESIDEFGFRLRKFAAKNNVFIITNNTVGSLYKNRLFASLEKSYFNFEIIELKDGEEYKSLDTAIQIYNKMSQERVERFTPVIGFGGGVVGDIAGFVASTYLRGLPFYNIPTSLIAQVDSSIGGKTGVNLKCGKNLVGTFYQPEYVHMDVELVKTLDKREYISGLAEVIKHAIIKGEKFLSYMEENIESILKMDSDVVEIMISECVRIKGGIVVRDEKESGLRRVLNLGHTLGHALEASMGYGNIRHGEGVAIGMVFASMLAGILGKGSLELTVRLKNILACCGLPVSIPEGVSIEEVVDAMYLDKKVRSKNLEFVLPLEPGKVECGIVVDEKIVRETLGKMEVGR